MKCITNDTFHFIFHISYFIFHKRVETRSILLDIPKVGCQCKCGCCIKIAVVFEPLVLMFPATIHLQSTLIQSLEDVVDERLLGGDGGLEFRDACLIRLLLTVDFLEGGGGDCPYCIFINK